MESGALSLEYIAFVKLAIRICNSSNLKIKMLSEPKWSRKNRHCKYSLFDKYRYIIDKVAVKILQNLYLPEKLHEKLMGLVFLIAARMLTWAVYHERILGISRKHCINLFHNNLFTSRGFIDNRKAAEVLIKDESLNNKQRYILCCLYCLVDHIPLLYSQLTKIDQESFYTSEGMIRFWTYYIVGDVDKHKGSKSLGQYRFERAVESGLLPAVQYCIEETKDVEENAIMWAAFQAFLEFSNLYDNRSDFQNPEYILKNLAYRDHYMDILYFLFTKMREDQQILFLKKVINTRMHTEGDSYPRILEYFLNWPYQDYFMKTAVLMWELLPESSYAMLLLRICEVIECSDEPLKFGQEKCYDYRGLLKEFWQRSPQHFKRFVLSNQKIRYRRTWTIITRKAGMQFMKKLLSLKKFTYEDGKIISIIFASAKAKQNIIFSEEWMSFCIRCLKKKEWKTLDRFMLTCFSSKDEENIFKMKLMSKKEAQSIDFIDFVKRRQWKAAESFLKMSFLGKEEIIKFKEEILHSDKGKKACRDLLLAGQIKHAQKIITWSFSSKAKAKIFKKELILHYEVLNECAFRVISDSDFVNDFMLSFITFDEEIREFKKYIVDKVVSFTCKELISRCCARSGKYGQVYHYSMEEKWLKVEKLLNWCFSSEEEINEFKKGKLLEEVGKEIHFDLIISSQWEEAETFFAWLGLSTEEVIKIKKETLCHYGAISIYRDMCSRNKNSLIEPFVKWFLIDEAAALEFKNFRNYLHEHECERSDLQNIDLLIEKRLGELGENKLSIKRKSERLSAKKRICKKKQNN